MNHASPAAGSILGALSYVQNIGRFESLRRRPETAFGPFTLVYSENGRGKTTLCSILRSLTTDDPAPILERKRLPATVPARTDSGRSGGSPR